jgi:hypothetical protein
MIVMCLCCDQTCLLITHDNTFDGHWIPVDSDFLHGLSKSSCVSSDPWLVVLCFLHPMKIRLILKECSSRVMEPGAQSIVVVSIATLIMSSMRVAAVTPDVNLHGHSRLTSNE